MGPGVVADTHAVDYGLAAPPYRPSWPFPCVPDAPVEALHLAAVPVTGQVYAALADGLAPVAGVAEHFAAGPCHVRSAGRHEALTGQTGGRGERVPQVAPAPSQRRCRATRLDAQAGPQRRSAAKDSPQSQPTQTAGDLNAHPFPDSNARRLLRQADGGRQPALAACCPPGAGTPADAITGAVRGRRPKPPLSNCAASDFNFVEAYLTWKPVRINAERLRDFCNEFGASNRPAQASGHVKHPEPDSVRHGRQRYGSARWARRQPQRPPSERLASPATS